MGGRGVGLGDPLQELEGTESAKPGSTMQASNSVVDTLTQQKSSCVRALLDSCCCYRCGSFCMRLGSSHGCSKACWITWACCVPAVMSFLNVDCIQLVLLLIATCSSLHCHRFPSCQLCNSQCSSWHRAETISLSQISHYCLKVKFGM